MAPGESAERPATAGAPRALGEATRRRNRGARLPWLVLTATAPTAAGALSRLERRLPLDAVRSAPPAAPAPVLAAPPSPPWRPTDPAPPGGHRPAHPRTSFPLSTDPTGHPS